MDVKKIRQSLKISQVELAKNLGISRELVSKMENGKLPISKSSKILLDKIISEKNTKNSESNVRKNIPFYDDVLAIGGKDLGANIEGVSEPTEYIQAGDWFRDAEAAMRLHGDSMTPKYSSGAIIVFKTIQDMTLVNYGHDYIIETTDDRWLKRLQKSDKQDCYLLCSYNEEEDRQGNLIYAPFEIHLTQIRRLFKVLGAVIRNESSRIVYNR